MSDAAHSLYEQIVKGKEKLLEQWKNEQFSETRLIDFKETATRDGKPTKDDRENLATALSGFANSDGGIIVWGVKARPDKDGADTIQELTPFPHPKCFISRLQNLTPTIVSPGVKGVDHIHLVSSNDRNKSYVVTYIPRSEGLPHMAIANNSQYRYYYRSGSSFLMMPPFMVADRYARRPQPKLKLQYYLRYLRAALRGIDGVYIYFSIENHGLGLARFPALALYENDRLALNSVDTNNGLHQRPRYINPSSDNPYVFAGGVNDVIYPNTRLDVTYASLRIDTMANAFEDIKFEYEIYCDGFALKDQATISGNSILDVVTSYKKANQSS